MTDMPTMQAAFRTTVSGGGKYEMVFRFPSMDAMHAADDEWRAALAPSTTPDTIGSHFGNGGGFDPVAGGEALREALEWYRDQLCEGFCEGFTPRICKAAMEENPTGGDCSGCRAVIALAALKGPAA